MGFIDLEGPCWDCHGEGEVPEQAPPYNRVRCRTCGGWGLVPSEAGEAVIALMRHQQPKPPEQWETPDA